jgi:hypothetical protein
MSTSQEIIAGTGGFQVVNGANATLTGQFNSVVVVADAVFSAFAINGTSVLSTKGLSGVTMKAGSFLPAGADNKITTITLTSGTVIAYS